MSEKSHKWKGRTSVTGAKLCETCSEGYLTVSRCDRTVSVVCVACIIVKNFSNVFRLFSASFVLFSDSFLSFPAFHNGVVHCCLCVFFVVTNLSYMGFPLFSVCIPMYCISCLLYSGVFCSIMVGHALLCDRYFDHCSL